MPMSSRSAVFLQMLAAIAQIEPIEESENQLLRLLREKNDTYDTSYQANIKEVQKWLLGIKFSFLHDYLGLVRNCTVRMLESDVVAYCPFGSWPTAGFCKIRPCCVEAPEPFEAAKFS